MARTLPRANIGKNPRGWFIYDTKTLRPISSFFPTLVDAKDEFDEYEGERWEFGEYYPFGWSS